MSFDPGNNFWIAFNTANNVPIPLVEISRVGLGSLKSGKPVKPKASITLQGPTGTSLPSVFSFALDVAENLWVTDQEDKAILEFQPAQIEKAATLSPVISLTSPDWTPEVMRFDANDNLWVSQFPTTGNPPITMQLWRFAPADRAATGSANPGLMVNLPDQLNPVDLAFDSSGNLWIAGSSSAGDVVEMFPVADLGAVGLTFPTAAVTITSPAFTGLEGGGSCLGGIDFDRSGDLWVSIGRDNADCGAATQVVEFMPSQLSAGGSLAPAGFYQPKPRQDQPVSKWSTETRANALTFFWEERRH